MASILIIGCGSIGERHLRCFQKTGRCTVTACDTNPALLAAMRERYDAAGFATLDEALATVPGLHVDDLLDDLSELVSLKGGKVLVLPASSMPSSTGLAAIYRY